MSTTLSAHGGGAQPARIDSSGKVTGGAAMRVYGFASEAEAQAAGYVCEGGPAMSVALITDAQLASGEWKLDGDPFAVVIYTAPDNIPSEGGFAVPVYPVNGWGSAPAPGGLTLPDVASATRLLDLQADMLALNDGDPVATWTDQSGAGHHFTQSNADNQPKYDSGAVHFTGFGAGSDPVTYMACSPFANGSLTFAVLAVAKFDKSIDDDSGFLSNWDVNGKGWEANMNYTTQDGNGGVAVKLYISNENGGIAINSFVISDNVYTVVECEINSATIGHAFVNGNNPNEYMSGAVVGDSSSANDVLLGANTQFLGFGDGFSGWLKAVLMYQITDLDNWPTDRAAITAWLAARYGITL